MPNYDLSEIEERMMRAVERVRGLVRAGMPAKTAVDAAASECRIDKGSLATAYLGKRGSLRRARVRLAKLRQKTRPALRRP